MATRNCPICNTSFIIKHNQRYCSPDCAAIPAAISAKLNKQKNLDKQRSKTHQVDYFKDDLWLDLEYEFMKKYIRNKEI